MAWYAIVIITLVVATAVSIAYYQFFYLPQANANIQIPKSITSPPETIIVRILPGSSLSSNLQFMEPKDATVVLGVNNKVVWVNEDTVFHTITTDNGYKDTFSGVFDSRERPAEKGGPFVEPGRTYEFTFTQAGTYPYHHEPHPHIKGTIIVLDK